MLLKQPRSNPSTPTSTLVPATKRARIDVSRSSDSMECSSFNESEMDTPIKDHFLGMYNFVSMRDTIIVCTSKIFLP